MKIITNVYKDGENAIYDRFDPTIVLADEDIEQYVDDVREFLKEQLMLIEEEV